jgi:hypothetical protein
VNALHRWLEKRRRAVASWPRLADALLSDRGARYVRYRLRFVLVRVLLRTALHVMELVLLSELFPLEWLAPVFIFRMSAPLISSFWWGALESLRDGVRALTFRRHGELGPLVDDWVITSMGIALTLFGLAVLWCLSGLDEIEGFSILDAYALAIALRAGLDCVTRTLHSSVYALQRVYRPLSTLALVDVVDLIGPILLWWWFGAWSFALSILVSAALRTVFGLHYVGRARQRARMPAFVFGVALRRMLRRRSWVLRGSVWKWGAASLLTQVDALLVIAFTGFGGSWEESPIAILLYLFSPLMMAGVGWARVFYFDLKRLEPSAPAFLMERFQRLLVRVALVFPAVAWVGVVGVTALLMPSWIHPGVALLLPLFWVRSLLALRQVRAFADGSTRALLRLSSAVVVTVVLAALLPFNDVIVLGVVVVLLGGALVAIAPSTPQRTVACVLTGLPHWVALARRHGASRVWVGRVNRRVSVPGKVARALAWELPGTVSALLDRSCLIWFDTSGAPEPEARRRLIVASGGAFASLSSSELGAGESLQAVLETRGVPLAAPSGVGAAAELLRRGFQQEFPAGHVLDGSTRGLPGALARASEDLRYVVSAVLGARAEREVLRPRGAHVDVAVYAPGGEAELVFVVPAERDRAAFSRFKSEVRRASLLASCDACGG